MSDELLDRKTKDEIKAATSGERVIVKMVAVIQLFFIVCKVLEYGIIADWTWGMVLVPITIYMVWVVGLILFTVVMGILLIFFASR